MTTNAVTPSSKRRTFLPIVLDVAVPVGTYSLLKNGFGMGTVGALAWSSVLPAVRTAWSAVVDRSLNAFAALVLLVNVASLAAGFVTGDARLMLAKDGAIGSVIGIGVLASVMAGRPMMTPAMKPWLTRARADREAAWTRLSDGSEAFRRAEWRFSVVWGVALLGECVVRVVLAYTVPVDTMVWLGVVLMIVTLSGTFLVSGALGAGPMAAMIAAEVKGCGPLTRSEGALPEGARSEGVRSEGAWSEGARSEGPRAADVPSRARTVLPADVAVDGGHGAAETSGRPPATPELLRS
ncbi:VC0807 family protein [Streptomyces sp. bgisy022]|uniref:VC0807 family protein n=1 Tax=Streptomyces sp. bgisy022 TaxID=3413769 RepID=UPI003D711CA6